VRKLWNPDSSPIPCFLFLCPFPNCRFSPGRFVCRFLFAAGFFSGRFVRRLFLHCCLFLRCCFFLCPRLFSLPSPFFFVAAFLSPVFFSPVAFFVCRPSFLQLFPTLFLWDGRRRDSLRTRPEGLFQRFFAANVTKLLNIFKIFIKYLRNSKTPLIFAVKF